MNLNIKLLECQKEILTISLYKDTIDRLDELSTKYNVVRVDLIRHAINNFLDSMSETK